MSILKPIDQEIANEAAKETQKLIREIDRLIEHFLISSNTNLKYNEKIIVANRAICAYGVQWSASLWSVIKESNTHLVGE